MTKPTYTPLKDSNNQTLIFEVPAQGGDLWTLIDDYIAGPAKVKIEVQDPDKALWQYATDHYCGPGGTAKNDVGALQPTAPSLKHCPDALYRIALESFLIAG